MIIILVCRYIIHSIKTRPLQRKHPNRGIKNIIRGGNRRSEEGTGQPGTTAGDGENSCDGREEENGGSSGPTQGQGTQADPDGDAGTRREPPQHPQVLPDALPLSALHQRFPVRVLQWVAVGGEWACRYV